MQAEIVGLMNLTSRILKAKTIEPSVNKGTLDDPGVWRTQNSEQEFIYLIDKTENFRYLRTALGFVAPYGLVESHQFTVDIWYALLTYGEQTSFDPVILYQNAPRTFPQSSNQCWVCYFDLPAESFPSWTSQQILALVVKARHTGATTTAQADIYGACRWI